MLSSVIVHHSLESAKKIRKRRPSGQSVCGECAAVYRVQFPSSLDSRNLLLQPTCSEPSSFRWGQCS
jgi:hypothetical protein